LNRFKMKWKDSEVSLKFIASQCWFNVSAALRSLLFTKLN
jgi:hypothetical protein